MRSWLSGCALALALAAAPGSAGALCIYKGVDNARTTLSEEFTDSRWVVRARVLSATDHWSDTGESWTLYQLQVVRTYKGAPPGRLKFLTLRDSGGFYMDRPWVALPKGHDIGGEYLLFLTPWGSEAPPGRVRGAVFVTYNCGQSRPWAEVSTADRRRLERLSARQP